MLYKKEKTHRRRKAGNRPSKVSDKCATRGCNNVLSKRDLKKGYTTCLACDEKAVKA